VKIFAGVLVIVLSLAPGTVLSRTVEEWKAIYAKETAKLERHHAAARRRVLSQYETALTAIKNHYAKGGDLNASLAVRQEMERFETERTVPTETPSRLPELIRKARGAYRKSLHLAAEEHVNKLSTLTGHYVKRLDGAKRTLVSADKLDEAVNVDAEIKRVSFILTAVRQELLATAPPPPEEQPKPASVNPTPPPTLTPRRLKKTPAVNPFKSELWTTNMTVAAGEYKIGKERITIKQAAKGVPKPTIEIERGTTIEDGTIYIDEGMMIGTGVVFEDVLLALDLGGRVEFEDCVFKDCNMRKGGGWFNSWSGKWVFKNCVFDGGFFDKWSTRNVGVKLSNCTFYDVDFPTFNYHKDAGSEAQHEWRTIEECLFKKCEVPASVMAATMDCVFDGCKFLTDPREYDYETPVDLRAIVVNTRGRVPPSPPNVTVRVSPVGDQAGSTLPYKFR